MNRWRWPFLLLALGILAGGGSFAQDPKTPPKTEPKVEPKAEPKVDPKSDPEAKVFRGQLPQNWKLLGLTDPQRQEIYKRQTVYRDKIGKLEAQIDELKVKQKKELEDVLTADQKKLLREIILGKSPPPEK